MSGPSEKAIEAAQAAMIEAYHGPWPGHVDMTLHAAHDPALGLDRSVCLRDVVEKVRPVNDTMAIYIERAFGGGHG